jgi:hypothetical protein
MDAAIDDTFGVDGAAHPKLRRGGSLRPVLEMHLAALLMYYPEMIDAGFLTG